MSENPPYTAGQTWAALKRCWKGYRIAKSKGDAADMQKYAERIRTLQGQLGVQKASFPELNLV